MGRYAAALEAANVSISRKDHWRIEDLDKAKEEKCSALKSLNSIYPSSSIAKKIRYDCE
jgi:hypothetical protein